MMSKAAALPILMYHHVSPNPGLVTVSPATFCEHMKALACAGWRTVGLCAPNSASGVEPDGIKEIRHTHHHGRPVVERRAVSYTHLTLPTSDLV